MANALLGQDKQKEALSFYQKALALRPDWTELNNNMGTAFQNQGKLNYAISRFKKALEIQPDYAEAMNNLGIAYRNQGRFKAAIKCYQAALQINPAYSEAHSNLLFCLNYDPAAGQKDNFAEACKWWHRHGLPKANSFVHRNISDPQRRLKIGYVSPDLRRHSVGFFFLPLMATHNHDKFEVFCYSEVKQPDEITQQIKTHADHWYSTVGRTDMAVAEKVHSDQIDILIDLAGHTANNRLLVFARKPAPIQVTWLGYPSTTGLTTIDYRVTDDLADPSEATDHLYSETLVRLPQGFLCYGPPAGEILHQVSGSVLLLKCKQLADASTRHEYLDMFARHGIGADRVRMLARTPSFREHLAWYNEVDIGLDPFPYNGTTTTCEALWMGVPVVTLRGDRHSARVGTSILSNIGLTDLIAETEEQYAIKAIKLATNMEKLENLRSEMRDRITSSPISDAKRFADEMESVFREIWRWWCRKETQKINIEHRTSNIEF
jgi:predicted O-linked N-acetylglucosamine transferase (SPINDLY family)